MDPAGESIRVELVGRKAKTGPQLGPEERLALFDENTKWLDKLQAPSFEKPRPKARLTRQTRGWAREDLYNDDRGLPRGVPRRH